MDRSAIFTRILIRNALRREAKLPPLDVAKVYRNEVRHNLWKLHVARHGAAVRDQVIQHRRKNNPDFGNSTGGRWAINLETRQRLEESFDKLHKV